MPLRCVGYAWRESVASHRASLHAAHELTAHVIDEPDAEQHGQHRGVDPRRGDADLRERLVSSGRQRVVERFGLDRMIDEYEATLAEL